MGWKSNLVRLALVEGIIAAIGTGSFLMFPEFGPWHWYGVAALMAAAVPFTYISDWRAKWRERVAARSTASAHAGTNPIQGFPELEACRAALTGYMALPATRMVGSAHIVGSAKLYPYLADLCRILDEQEIPHPEIDYHLTIVDTGKWARFLGDLWAARHDLERARRVYRDEESRP